jgi:cytochrome c biogenesis protein CcmG, thiol:disulfide interchange protein DsbE
LVSNTNKSSKKINVKNILSIFIILAISFGFTQPVSNKQLPNITISDLQGKPVNIQEIAGGGKITVLSFWATWCAPCKRELDAIAELYPAWSTDYNTKLVAITIDNARALTQVKPLIQEKGWEFEVLSDSKQELQQALNFQAIPQTFVVDTNGNIVYQHEGYTPGDEYELEKVLKNLAGK